jgi:hypothetical protein
MNDISNYKTITIDGSDNDYDDFHIIKYLDTYQTHNDVHTIDICTYTVFKSDKLHNKLCVFAKKCVNLKRIKLNHYYTDDALHNVAIVIKLLDVFSNVANIKLLLADTVYSTCDIDLLGCYLKCSPNVNKIKIRASNNIIFNIVQHIKYNNSIKSINLSFASVDVVAPLIPITTKINKVSYNYCDNICDTFCDKFTELNPSITKLKLFAIENIDLALNFINRVDSETLCLRGYFISDKKFKELSKTLALSNIKKFKIDLNCSNNRGGVNAIVNILSTNKSLTYVDIGKNWMRSKHIALIIKSLATNSTIKTFLCQHDLLDFNFTDKPFSEISAREILESLEETCINILSENYILQHFAMVITYGTIFSECIKLKTITDRNIELMRKTRFAKTKVAQPCVIDSQTKEINIL